MEAEQKREGDKKTPRGKWHFASVYYRPDRVQAPLSYLPQYEIVADSGWCDDPASKLYNRYVTLPKKESCETLHRQDSSYDILVTLNHNSDPVVPGMGSAIFIHCMSAEKSSTAGCVALPVEVLWSLLEGANSDTHIQI